LNFLGTFSKKGKTSSFIKIRPVGAELFYAGGRTDGHEKRIISFRNYANAPKNEDVKKDSYNLKECFVNPKHPSEVQPRKTVFEHMLRIFSENNA
jgi:hypothetical protein